MQTPSDSQNLSTLVARILMALLFIPAGLGKVVGFAGTSAMIASKGLPLSGVLTAVAILVEVGLPLLLLVGFQTRWSAILLAVFTLVITFIFHNFWAAPEAEKMMHLQAFFKNLAIVGGLFMLSAFGPGRHSLEGRGTSVRVATTQAA